MSWITQLKSHRPSLFWRTFLLLCCLVFISVMGWLQSFRVLTEMPYAQGISQHIISTVNITKYALVSADPIYRMDLLRTLAAREGVLISPRDPTDKIQKFPNDGYNGLIETLVKQALGPDTIVATHVNGNHGIWVTFDIDGDVYWMQTPDDALDPPYGTSWLYWAIAACLISLCGATMLAKHVITPLTALSNFARSMSRGVTPAPLPENASTSEIQSVNVNFNRMVQDLARMEADRELLLAGVSHDLRTPITRLRLEVELAGLPDDTRVAMVSDLEQMENIVNQFIAYARRTNEEPVMVNFGEAVTTALHDARIGSDPSVEVTTELASDIFVMALPLELSRAIQNLVVNAQRYGRSEDGVLRLSMKLSASKDGKTAVLAVADAGKGLPENQRARVMRPFERGESARSGVTGSGLGLSIVDRIVRRSGGTVTLGDAEPHGLLVLVQFPLLQPAELKKALKEQDKAAEKIEDSEEKKKEAEAAAKPAVTEETADQTKV
ncbi:ATP-binding protein [Sutterella sp.]|uniref:ATP-binding protein n=1 Tax=Sutterella sp. TaxID=1981025 RepID=UPI0026E0A9E9|nr:ATP-binding protein [Sutterella sp.]MDO5531810.1 ATP-binding protein [Sutterella sp.]